MKTSEQQMNLLFNSAVSQKRKDDGMARAAAHQAQELQAARDFAATMAKSRDDRCVTADDVGRYFPSLGPAAGSLFKTPMWKWTGQYTKSARVTNHSRMLRVWRYIGP